MSMSSHSQPPAAMPGYGGHAAGIVGYKQEAGCDGRTAAGNGFTQPANHSQYSHYNGYSGYTGHGYGDGLDPGQHLDVIVREAIQPSEQPAYILSTLNPADAHLLSSQRDETAERQFNPDKVYNHKLTPEAAELVDNPSKLKKSRWSGREARDFGTLLTLREILKVTEHLLEMAHSSAPAVWHHDALAVQSTIIETYYRFLKRSDLAEFNQVVAALSIEQHHIRPVYFRPAVRSKLLEIVSSAEKHKNFRSFFIYYFAPTINKWI